MKPEIQHENSKARVSSSMTPARYATLLAVAITAPLGDTLLARGMKSFGPVSLHDPVALVHALFTPYVALGVAMLIGFFATYSAALSWADLTYVLPTTSIGNVLIALLARFWLHEPISFSRWLGIGLITMGVGFVANGSSYTEHPACLDERTQTVSAATETEGGAR